MLIIVVNYFIKSNQIKFNKQQRAKSHLQVAKTLIKTINIFLIIHTEGKRSNRLVSLYLLVTKTV